MSLYLDNWLYCNILYEWLIFCFIINLTTGKEFIKMKKTLLISIFLCVFASSAWSLAVLNPNLTNVGDPDSFIAAELKGNLPTNSGNGELDELTWINLVLHTSFTLDDFNKTETPQGSGWLQTYNDAGTAIVPYTYAFDFGTSNPMYFLVKTGNLQAANDYRYFLFANENELLNWGVINLQGYNLLQIGKISHVDTAGGAPVPEPTTLILLGTGLLGLAGLRRKIKK